MKLYPLNKSLKLSFIWLLVSAAGIYCTSALAVAEKDQYSIENCIDVTGYTNDTDEEGNPVPRARQITTLINVFFGGQKSPSQLRNLLCHSDENYKRSKAFYDNASDEDKEILTEYYGDDLLLKLTAVRDTDNDGIKDFRVKEEGGFIENDGDADGDKVINILDPNPLDPDPVRDAIENNDLDGDKLPDHLDWSNNTYFLGKSENLVQTQSEIFTNYGVILNESDFEFSEVAAAMMLDVLNIFSKDFEHQDFDLNETLKVITSGKAYSVSDYDVLAEVSSINGRVNIFKLAFQSINKNPGSKLAAFTVMIHEMVHTIQNAMDFEQNKEALQTKNYHKTPTNFASLMNSLGWKMNIKQQDDVKVRAFVDHGTESIGAREIYAGKHINAIRGDHGFLDLDMRKKQKERGEPEQ